MFTVVSQRRYALLQIVTMNNSTTATIFYSIEITSHDKPAEIQSILDTVDYINKSIPNIDEFQDSLNWLIENNLIEENSNRYRSSQTGKKIIEIAEKSSNQLLNICENIEMQFINVNNNRA